ncbi:RHS repeat-associated protein [Streptomyces sp. SLBN-118]|nr:RHS repeat-associated protein [Streptomyces sp. SLBN-118]
MVVESTGEAIALTAERPAASAPSVVAPGPAEAQDEASALLTARLQDRKIEVLSERTADSTTYALPTGELQTSSYAGPIRVDQNGVWRDIDTSLSDSGPALTPDVAAAEITVADGGDTALASVSKGEKSFGLGWASKLPTPTVKDDTASYGLGEGQTLTVTALPQGFSQNVLLDKAPAGAVSYRMPLDLDGLKLSQADSGHLLLQDSSGKLVAEAPAPMMWDSSKNPVSGEPEHQARIATKIETAADGSQTLVLTPDEHFLTEATYPVTVDPTSTLAVTTDTWLQTPDYTDSQVSSTELKSGTYDGGTHKARSYLNFDVSKFAGKHITDTNLSLYSYYSSTCSTSGAGTQVRRITSNWSSSTITWGAQPTTTTTGAVTNTAALGYSSSCPAGTMNFDIDAIVQAWANGSANYGLQILGANETDTLTWRRFRSANYISGDNSVEPHLTVTYNSYATTSALAISPSVVNAYNGKRYVTSLTPTLSAKVSDADGGSAQAQFELTADPAYSDTTYAYTAYGKTVPTGFTSTLAVPSANAFPAGTHLRARSRAFDGTDYGSWSGYTTFVLNTGLPAAPTVSCATYAQDTWAAKAAGAVTCTLDTTSTDGQGFKWGLDDPALSKRVDDTADHSIQGQTVTDTDTGGQTYARTYTYDNTGRLTRADDTAPDGTCTRRGYTFDNNTNRTALATSTSAAGTACTSTGATTTTSTYDSADRLVKAGIVYDAFGRTTTQASGATIGYYTNDLVRQQTTATSRQTWTLDAAQRLAAWTTESTADGGATWTQTSAKTNHYGGDGDSPDWIKEDTAGVTTRNVQGSSGNLDATTSTTGDTVLQLTNIHGDVTVQLPLDTTKPVVALAHDEYGNPEAGTAATRYGWIGSKQRSSETVTGAILMGVRLYDQALGRFLSVDPIPGGNANAYDYCTADPVNCYDLDGRFGWGKWIDRVGTGLAIAGMFGCAACSAISAGISLGRGIYKVRHGDRSGWMDIAGSATFGAGKGFRYAGKFWKGRKMARYAKGARGRGRYNKRMRSRAAKAHRLYHHHYTRRADGIDRWYGGGSMAYGLYGEHHSYRQQGWRRWLW